ncbi:D-amino acid aminotransferase [Gracilibacillus halophilus YIM-C55.5]|uniref:D-alanine aminotransferase n=2 Tax=Gracilibacillus TaxID=74385 RepID=N4WSR1_9BACI|nr:D-amino acid aminotransferase [Gracilibacillus halophilus YIM-C55.5]
MNKYVLWNGKILDQDDKEVSVSYEDRGYQFGDGVYEVIRIYQGAIHLLDWHLDRLFYSMKEIDIVPPFTREQLIEQLRDVIKANQFQADGKLYIQVTRGEQPRDHLYEPNLQAVYYAIVTPFEKPVDMWENGVTVMLQEDIRWLRCDIKSLNLLPNVMARTTAQKNGYDEPLFYRDGIVRECGASNFFLVKDQALVTHPTDHHILGGITRKQVIRLAKELGIPVYEREIDLNELEKAHECFLTATPLEIVPITQIDEKKMNGGAFGPITKKLFRYYQEKIPEDLFSV